MVVNVIGLGKTAKDYEGGFSIGVNDVLGCACQVCVDRQNVFSPERLNTINRLSGKPFFSQLDDWKHLDLHKINLKNINAHNGRWNEFIPSSNNSPFVACGIAYHIYGAKEIRLWGIDFNDHPNIKDEMREQAVRDYALLNEKIGGIIKPHPDSYLFGKI